MMRVPPEEGNDVEVKKCRLKYYRDRISVLIGIIEIASFSKSKFAQQKD